MNIVSDGNKMTKVGGLERIIYEFDKYKNIGSIGRIVDRPKALGDIRGISYIYGIFCRFGLIKKNQK